MWRGRRSSKVLQKQLCNILSLPTSLCQQCRCRVGRRRRRGTERGLRMVGILRVIRRIDLT